MPACSTTNYEIQEHRMPKVIIRPTGPFLYVHFVPKEGTHITVPDGSRGPNEDVVIQDIGPEVPIDQGFKIGGKVLLRGDAKIFPFPMDGLPFLDGSKNVKAGPACIDYRSVMGVIEEEAVDTDVTPLTDEQIDAIRLG